MYSFVMVEHYEQNVSKSYVIVGHGGYFVGFGWGNQGEANFQVGLQKYFITAAHYFDNLNELSKKKLGPIHQMLIGLRQIWRKEQV